MFKDYYLPTLPWYWLLQVLWIVYAIAVPCFIVLILDIYIPDTLFTPNLPYGTYFSMRYTSFWWVCMFMAGFKLLMPVMGPLATLWRKNRGCSIMWIVFIFCLFAVGLFVFVGLSTFYGTCNRNGQVNNPCNSIDWCCVPEIYSNPENACPQGNYPCECPANIVNVVDCPVYPQTIAGLAANSLFLWVYFVQLFFTIADGVLVAFYMYKLFEIHVFPEKVKRVDKDQ